MAEPDVKNRAINPDYQRLRQELGGEDAVRKQRRDLEAERIEKEIREGKFPRTKKRAVLQGPLLQVSPLLIRNGPFRFHHPAGVTHYDLNNPLIQENSWGYCYYIGPPLYPFDLVVYATMLQLFGTNVMTGPRKSFQMLRIMDKGGVQRPPSLENPDFAMVADPYESLEAIFGEAYVTAICEEIYGYRNGHALKKVINSLLNLMQGQVYTHVNPKRKHKDLPRWAKMGESPLVLDADVVGQLKSEFHIADVNPRMLHVLGYDQSGESPSPIRRHLFFDPFFKNGLDPRQGFPFIVSHFHSEIMRTPDNERERAALTFLERRVIRGLLGDETALSAYMVICSLTNADNPELLYGYDVMYDLMGCCYVKPAGSIDSKKRVGRGKTSSADGELAPNYSEFRKQLLLRMPKLAELGVTTPHTGYGDAKPRKLSGDKNRKLFRFVRTFPEKN